MVFPDKKVAERGKMGLYKSMFYLSEDTATEDELHHAVPRKKASISNLFCLLYPKLDQLL